MPAKLDLRKQLKHVYSAVAGRVTEIVVPAMKFLMVDGKGDPKFAGISRRHGSSLFRFVSNDALLSSAREAAEEESPSRS